MTYHGNMRRVIKEARQRNDNLTSKNAVYYCHES